MTPSRSRSPLTALLAALAVASSAAGGLLLVGDPEAGAADVGQVPAVALAEARPPAAGSPRAERPPETGAPPEGRSGTRPPRPRPAAPARPRPAVPVRLLIDAAGLHAPVVPVGADGDGQLAIPEAPGTVGWWVGSAPAGDPEGSTLVAGHVDSASGGLGALAVLRTLPLGTRVVLADVFGGRHAYRVAARRSYPKQALPPEVLRGHGPRLVLVTCGGPFDEASHSYRDNLVVFAVPA